MCYSGDLASVIGHRDLVVRRRWYALQANMAAVVADNHVHAESFAVGDGRGGGGGAAKRYCLCSPTQHPGSFRCRQHLGEYAWGTGRVVRNRVE
ncbi:hypothetical protein L484_020813 [Morus notabilis]|uniref:Uncharacterized protein n=1 Tax=Morus notabilis TaxID=981085 RepID=W9R2I8_9ROSA|nr:hypothetical protein L484_020813 [Morus notabilis]